MKFACILLPLLVVLTGCFSENSELNQALEFRDALLSANGCSFCAEVTADYGDSLHCFKMNCQADSSGTLSFEVIQPESIAGIKGTISDSGGEINFEDQALYFPLLTDDLLTPASAPWIFLRTLRSGYITSACSEEKYLHLTIDDSYADDALTLDIWISEEEPVQADIFHDGRRILSISIENFEFL